MHIFNLEHGIGEMMKIHFVCISMNNLIKFRIDKAET